MNTEAQEKAANAQLLAEKSDQNEELEKEVAALKLANEAQLAEHEELIKTEAEEKAASALLLAEKSNEMAEL